MTPPEYPTRKPDGWETSQYGMHFGGCTAIETEKCISQVTSFFEKRRGDREIVAIGASVTVPRPSRHSCTLYGLHSMTLATAMQGRRMRKTALLAFAFLTG